MNGLNDLPRVVLVGTGVVGLAILKAHLDSNVSVCVSDQNQDSLQAAVDSLQLDTDNWRINPDSIGPLSVISLSHQLGNSPRNPTPSPWIVIESIPENLDIKQRFFRDAQQIFGDDAILCSNTSTLRIGSIGNGLPRPDRICGMHFFMPVDQRPAVEIVRTSETDDDVTAFCRQHADRIGKSPLVVADQPGFIVNRLLSPYLNQSLLLLAHGVDSDRIERAALAYGMPLSPLELIDWIGTRTMFDAGRAFWQAFPNRIDPSPIVPALVKQKRAGRATSAGLFDYIQEQRSPQLAPQAQAVIDRYKLDPIEFTDDDLLHLLAIPMWIEADLAFRDGVTQSLDDFDLAMSGGLGYQHPARWRGFFESLGRATIDNAIERWSGQFKSMRR
ncbi:MAG: 3-hydroxyacyl-CoA dehydrogenase family protein [Pirellulaceae bacterium]|nr:3-hydroxyacyl-CoA dehydrogenase family protein [Pirellulaceae bacterium]